MWFNSKIFQLLNNIETYQTKEYHVFSWQYIPDTNTLLEYLEPKDLIELSKCSKRYRKQLERRVLESLELGAWKCNKNLEFLKNDLGGKLKLVKKFTLYSNVGCGFAKKFVKLFPNIKTLSLQVFDCDDRTGDLRYNCRLEKGLKLILKHMVHLEHVIICGIDDKIRDYSTEKQIFPKSIKSLKIRYVDDSSYSEDELSIYNTIDTSYTNLYSLSVSSNRMLQNLPCGMPNLKEVDIEILENLDVLKVVAFLKANLQLKKLVTNLDSYNEEIIKTVISFKYLEHWCIRGGNWKEIEFNNLPSNHSIKYLIIYIDIPASISLRVINACSKLDYLYTSYFNISSHLSKLKRRINTIELYRETFSPSVINDIDNLKPFNQIHLKYVYYANEEICNYKFNNYKLIRLMSRDFVFKLINKTN